MFNDLKDVPKERVREYQTSAGAKVREVGHIVYGCSMTIGSDGKPHVKEFRNVNPGKRYCRIVINKLQITDEREPLSDITTPEKEVKVVLEMPGIKKEILK